MSSGRKQDSGEVGSLTLLYLKVRVGARQKDNGEWLESWKNQSTHQVTCILQKKAQLLIFLVGFQNMGTKSNVCTYRHYFHLKDNSKFQDPNYKENKRLDEKKTLRTD